MAYVVFTDISGQSVRIDPTLVRAVVPLADDINFPAAQCTVLTGSGLWVTLAGTALATITALGLIGSAVAIPISQELSGPSVLGGLNAYVLPGSNPELAGITAPGITASLTRLAWLDGASTVLEGTPAGLAASLAGSSPVTGSSRLLLTAVILANGTIASQASDAGITIAATAPYVPGTGDYSWTLSGTLPASVVPTVSPLPDSPIRAFAVLPLGGALFASASRRPGNVVAAGRVDATGALVSGFGATTSQTGVGDYLVTLPYAPGNISVTLGAIGTSLASWSPVSGTEIAVGTASNAAPAVPADAAFSFEVTTDDSGNLPGLDGNHVLQFWNQS